MKYYIDNKGNNDNSEYRDLTDGLYDDKTDWSGEEEQEVSYTRKPRFTWKSKKPWLKLTAYAMAFGLIAGGTFAGVTYAQTQLTGTTVASSATAGDSSSDSTSSSVSSDSSDTSVEKTSSTTTDAETVASNVLPSVVSITAVSTATNMFGQTQESEGAGSGFIIRQTDDTVYIATNYHVIEGASTLSVGFVDDSTVSASVVGYDSTNDLAVIAVKSSDMESSTLDAITVATLGDSDDLKAGQTVIAIGNALGYGQSVTTGVVSATNREVSFDTGTMTLIQTDAAINPGNSGGVLVNTDGEVIGINNAKLEDTSVEGMGYAIPMSTAKTILTNIMDGNGTTDSTDSSSSDSTSQDDQSASGSNGSDSQNGQYNQGGSDSQNGQYNQGGSDSQNGGYVDPYYYYYYYNNGSDGYTDGGQYYNYGQTDSSSAYLF